MSRVASLVCVEHVVVDFPRMRGICSIGEGWTTHCPPALFIFSSGDQLALTSSNPQATDQCTVAQRVETTVNERSPTNRM